MSETESFDIMFDDLSEDAKKRFLDFLRLETAEDGNYDCNSIATVEIQTEVLEENEEEMKSRKRERELTERKKREEVSFT